MDESQNVHFRPPDGCLQWYTGTDGQITSFNFEGNTGHLATQNYNICIRKEKGFCCVKYSVCTEDNSFNINSLKDMAADMKALDDELCIADYIRIEGSSSTCGLEDATERYCGQKLADVKEGAANLPICGKFLKIGCVIFRLNIPMKCFASFQIVPLHSKLDLFLTTCLMPNPLWFLTEVNKFVYKLCFCLHILLFIGFCLDFVQTPCGSITP